MMFVPAKTILRFFVPLYACCAGSDRFSARSIRVAATSSVNNFRFSGQQQKALENFAELCRSSNATRMIIEQNGRRLAQNTFDPRGKQSLDTMSVTKAITGLAMGVFLSETKTFSNDRIQVEELVHPGISIAHVLSHSSGLRLPEDDQVGQIYQSHDYSTLFRRAELRFHPGSRSEYSNLAVNLLSLIIQRQTNKTLADYVRQNVFFPLRINNAIWESDRAGHSFAMAGLHLEGDDMVKISSLLLNKGVFEGKQVIPESYISDLWHPTNFFIDDSIGGRVSWQNLWAQTYYESPTIDPKARLPSTAPDLLSANGYGGQYIIVLRKSRLQIITQRDMDFAKPAPPLGGESFLKCLRQLDEAYSLKPPTDTSLQRQDPV